MPSSTKGQRVAHLSGLISTIAGIAETEATGRSSAPALDAAVIDDDACGNAGSRDGLGSTSGTEVDGGQCVAHLTRHISSTTRVAQPELAHGVESPAFDVTVVEDGASVVCAGGDGLGSASGTEADEGQCVPHLSGLVSAIVGVADPELAIGIVPPTLYPSVIEDRAGEAASHRDCSCGPSGAKVDERQRVSHLCRLIAPICRIAETELTGIVPAPALEAVTVQDGANVVTSEDRRGGECRAEVDER